MFTSNKSSDYVIDALQQLELPGINLQGVCYGIAIMAERARRCGEYPKFSDRMHLLKKYYTDARNELARDIHLSELHEKLIRYRNTDYETKNFSQQKLPFSIEEIRSLANSKFLSDKLSDEEKAYLLSRQNEIPAELSLTEKQLLTVKTFLIQVVVHFNPTLTQNFLDQNGAHINQTDIREAEKLLYDSSSDDPMESPLNQPSSYLLYNNSQRENIHLRLALDAVKDFHLDNMNSSSIGLTLSSGNHTVHLFYDKGKWHLTDHSNLVPYNSIDDLMRDLNVLFGMANLEINLFSDNPSDKLKTMFEAINNSSLAAICRAENINALDKIGMTPLAMAALTGDMKNIKILMDNKALLNVNGLTYSPLRLAAQEGHAESVAALLKGGADPNMANPEDGSTPLISAASKGHIDSVQILLEGNSNPNIVTRSGHNALFFAAKNGHVECVNLILSTGKITTVEMNAPLFLAAQKGRVECVKALLSGGADRNFSSETNLSILQQIASLDPNATKRLNDFVKNNPQKDYTKNFNLTLLEIAEIMGHTKVAETLKNFLIEIDEKRNIELPTPKIIASSQNEIYALSEIDQALANLEYQLFSESINAQKVFNNDIEKILLKNNQPNGSHLAYVLNNFKLNLFKNSLLQKSQNNLTIDTVQSYQGLASLVDQCLAVIKTYKIGFFDKPLPQFFALLTNLSQLYKQNLNDPDTLASDLMKVLQTTPIPSNSRSAKLLSNNGFATSVNKIVNDVQFLKYKDKVNSPIPPAQLK